MKELIYFLFFLVVICVAYVLTLILCTVVLPECVMPFMFLFLGYLINDFERLVRKIYNRTETGHSEELRYDENEREVIEKALKNMHNKLMDKKFVDISSDEMDDINTISKILKRM